MNKKFKKLRFVALLCSICLIFTSCFTGLTAVADEGDILLENSEEYQYDDWTFISVGINDATDSTSSFNSSIIPCSLDETIFNAKIKFPSENDDFGYYYFGGSRSYTGFYFHHSSSDPSGLAFRFKTCNIDTDAYGTGDKYLWGEDRILNSEVAGVALRGNSDLQVSISVKYTSAVYTSSLGNNVVDLKVGLWFNGKLYNNEYFTYTAVPTAALGRSIKFDGVTKAYSISSQALSEKSLPTEYKHWTFLDSGLNDGSYSSSKASHIDNDMFGTMDKTMFSGYINFPTNMNNIYIGGRKDWCGFLFQPNGTDKLNFSYFGSDQMWIATELNSAIAGCELRNNPDLLVQIYVEYVNVDSSGIDVKIGLYFNGKLYNNTYFYLADVPAEGDTTFGTHIHLYTGTDAYQIRSAGIHYDTVPAEIADYEKWSFNDVNFSSNTYSSKTDSGYCYGTMNESCFTGNVTFNSAGTASETYLFLGNSGSWSGICFRDDSGGKLLVGRNSASGIYPIAELDPAVAGLETFRNNKFKLSVATRKTGDNPNGTIRAEMFIFINDVLYNNESYMVNLLSNACFNKSVSAGHGGAITVENIAVTNPTKTIPTGLTALSLGDLGIQDATGFAGFGGIDGSFNNTVVGMKLKFDNTNAEGSRIHFGMLAGGSSYDGIGLRLENGNLVIGYERALETSNTDQQFYNKGFGLTALRVTPQSVGAESFTEQENTFKITTQFVDSDLDGEEDDIKVGIFVNDILCNNQFLYILNSAANLGSAVHLGCQNFKSVASTEMSAKAITDDYTGYSIADAGITEGNNAVVGQLCNASAEPITGYDYDNVDFGLKVKFASIGAAIHYGAYDANVDSGFKISLQSDGKLLVEKDTASSLNMQSFEIDPVKAGLTVDSFQNQKFTLNITTKVVDIMNEDDSDILLGIWINGKLYNESWVLISSATAYFGEYIGFDADGVYRWSVDSLEDGDTVYFELDSDSYLVTADSMYDTRGNTYTKGDTITAAGDYTAVYNANGDIPAYTVTVIIWQEYNLSADDVIDIRDLVATKKALAGIDLATQAGTKAAEYINDATDLANIRTYLLTGAALPKKK